MKKDKPYLQHIYDAICDIEKFVENTTMELFFENREKQYAVIRAIEIIGEATKNLSPELKARHSKVPWKTIAGIRDILIHKYFGIKLERIWEVTQEDIPELKNQIAEVLREIGEKDKETRK